MSNILLLYQTKMGTVRLCYCAITCEKLNDYPYRFCIIVFQDSVFFDLYSGKPIN
ncbi:hypothetical protein ISN44_As04g037690 [Arabidopsis suecica]|uniref:Uncharacterized protein n=1 Tax=Arabidopsis suecica TaxID=45249 RepID=A0A8T2EI66_ARASU|nr:hypothetical protein ISN44_As04g037660 [Arabidopsis suecica]KAG7623039.1 hypothetical protein ISN44_As04g037690 [Arabidopsis suecica]